MLKLNIEDLKDILSYYQKKYKKVGRVIGTKIEIIKEIRHYQNKGKKKHHINQMIRIDPKETNPKLVRSFYVEKKGKTKATQSKESEEEGLE